MLRFLPADRVFIYAASLFDGPEKTSELNMKQKISIKFTASASADVQWHSLHFFIVDAVVVVVVVVGVKTSCHYYFDSIGMPGAISSIRVSVL